MVISCDQRVFAMIQVAILLGMKVSARVLSFGWAHVKDTQSDPPHRQGGDW